MISLPFTALYSGILTLGAAAAIEVGIRDRALKLGPAYQAAGATLALATSTWIALRDLKERKTEDKRPSIPAGK